MTFEEKLEALRTAILARELVLKSDDSTHVDYQASKASEQAALAAVTAHVEGLEGRIKELESREGMPVDTLLGKLSKVEAEVARLEKVIEQWQSRWDEHCSQVMFDDVARLAAENARLQLDIGQTAMRYEERISLLTRECARLTEENATLRKALEEAQTTVCCEYHGGDFPRCSQVSCIAIEHLLKGLR